MGLDAAVTSPSERDAVLQTLGERLDHRARAAHGARSAHPEHAVSHHLHRQQPRHRAQGGGRAPELLRRRHHGHGAVEHRVGRTIPARTAHRIRSPPRGSRDRSSPSSRRRNVGLVPGDEGDYFQRLTTEIAEVKRVESALSVAVNRRAELQRQLRGEAPFVPPTDPAFAPRTPTRSAAAGHRQPHPGNADAPRRAAAALHRQTSGRDRRDARLSNSCARASRKKSRRSSAATRARPPWPVRTSNPVYQSIQLQLNQVEVDIAALRGQLVDHRRSEQELRRLVEYRARGRSRIRASHARLRRHQGPVQRAARAPRNARKLSGDAEADGRGQVQHRRSAVGGLPADVPESRRCSSSACCSSALALAPASPTCCTSEAGILAVRVAGGCHRSAGARVGDPHLARDAAGQLAQGLLRYSAASGLLLVLFASGVVLPATRSRWLRQLLGMMGDS